MKTSAHTKIGLENEDTRKLRNEVTLFSTIITVPPLEWQHNDKFVTYLSHIPCLGITTPNLCRWNFY
jgi:hypothetical protein